MKATGEEGEMSAIIMGTRYIDYYNDCQYNIHLSGDCSSYSI